MSTVTIAFRWRELLYKFQMWSLTRAFHLINIKFEIKLKTKLNRGKEEKRKKNRIVIADSWAAMSQQKQEKNHLEYMDISILLCAVSNELNNKVYIDLPTKLAWTHQ